MEQPGPSRHRQPDDDPGLRPGTTYQVKMRAATAFANGPAPLR